MTRGNLLARLLLVFVFSSIFLLGSAQAQFRGALRGTVTDPQGAAVAGATVTLTDAATSKTLSYTTDANGIYEFNALPPDPFRLTVEQTGFDKKVIEHVVIIPEQPNALNVQLVVGQVQTTVTVSGTTEALDTETATTSGTINSNQIQNMPSFGRDVFQLIQLAPGMFGDGAQGNGGGAEQLPGTQGPGGTGGNTGIFATENGPQALAHGGQYENNGYSIDGISTTSAVWGGTTVITPSEDSVDNVKIVSNSYDAESGRFSGAQVQVTSKSGTNHFHGSLFFTSHRPGLNAFQSYNGPETPGTSNKLRDPNFFDQFGGSVGGPIWKNKVFFFFDYETVRSPKNQPNIANGWYDTAAFDALGPAGSISSKYLTFPGSAVVSQGIIGQTCALAGLNEGVNCVTIPGQGLNIGTPLTAGLGTQDFGWFSPNAPGTGGDGSGGPENLGTVADIADYSTVSNTTYSKAQYNGRVDADLTAKDHVAGAIYWVPQSTTFLNGPAREYNFFHHSQVNDAFSVIWNRTISPSFLNEARVNAAGWRWNEINSNPQSPVGLPSDTIGNIGSITDLASFGPNVGSILNQWTYTGKDVATKIIGRHTVKFGGEVTRLFYLQDCAGCGVPSYNFFNMWDFLNDAPHQEGGGFNPTTGNPTTIRQDQRTDIWGFFAQDDYKVRSNLTVNLGLRWSYFGPLSSKEGNMLVATPGVGANYLTGLTVHKGNSWKAQKGNFGPELGFAWSPTQYHDKLVIRGGYGLNYNQEELAISANISNNPGLVTFPSLTFSTPCLVTPVMGVCPPGEVTPNPGIIYGTSTNVHSLYGYPTNPNTISAFGTNGLPTTGSVGVEIFPNTLPTMFTEHYSLDTQYDLGHQWISTLGYMGTVSRNIYFHQNPNATPAADGFALNPQIGGGDYWGVNGKGNYNALLAGIKHQFSRQFMSDAEFTWAKSLDDSSAPYSEQDYAFNPSLNYGPSDYNVAKAFKLYGLWQPVFFHGSRSWMDKVAGGWTLSGIFNWHSGFPWTPVANVVGGNLYCGICGYSQLPALYLGGAGNSTSNTQFRNGSNYPLVASQGNASAYFATPAYTAYSGNASGDALPQVAHRNTITGPGYRDVDMTLAKSFGLPNAPVLGENAKLELRMDVFNLFNTLNFNPTNISNNISSSNFGVAQSALAARVLSLTARFSF